MPRRHARSLPLLLALLVAFPTTLASDAAGPDADGAWTLRFGLDLPAAGTHRATLDVRREDADGALAATRDLGERTLPAGPSTLDVAFLPAEGSGRYTVALLLDGARASEVVFEVDDAAATRTVQFDVEDAPTYLNLTSDDVNNGSKTKSPGDALLTRATLSDANGLAELDGVAWTVERAGAIVHSGALAYTAAPDATSAALEQRFDRAPIAAGEHTLRLTALKHGAPVASAARTFFIREVAPTFVSGALANVTPDVNLTQEAPVVLADKNGEVGPGAIEARVYRGSARMEGAGFAASLGAPLRLADENGTARWSYPLALRVPARATSGLHRVSIYVNDSLLGSMPFDVKPLPRILNATANTSAGRLVVGVDTSAESVVTLSLTDGDGATASVTAIVPAHADLALDPPRHGVPLRWTAALRAREGGPVLDERNGTWTAPASGPTLRLAPLHVRARLPAAWAIDAEGWDLAAANATWTFARWDGAPEPRLTGALVGDRARVDGPADLAAGRYSAQLSLAWANGTHAQASWTFDAGPWVVLTLSEPVVEGRNATLALQNAGGIAVTRVVVEAQPAANLTLRADNVTRTPATNGTRAVFSGVSLSPGEEAELRVRLPDGPAPAGRRVVTLRVLARVEIG